jgi:DNA-binding NarL/FixJ family response regulator
MPGTAPTAGSASTRGSRCGDRAAVTDKRVIRVVVADDHDLLRTGLALILDAQPDIEVVGQAADGRQAVALARQTSPDVVLMDVRMPHLDGVAATREIVATHPASRVLVLTTFDVDDYVLGALRAGASGFLLKDTPRASLLAAVRAVAEGDVLLSHEVTTRLVHAVREQQSRTDVDPALRRLTPRERDVLRLVAQGNSNAEIAAQLYLGETTVKTHVARLLDKLDARDRVQLVVRAHRWGIAEPPG